MLRVFFDERFGCSGLPLCEIFLINSLSLSLLYLRAFVGACVPSACVLVQAHV